VTTVRIPDDVAAAWGFAPDEVAPLAGGLINTTFVATRDAAPVAVIQRLHHVFAAEVNLDLEAVTAHVAARGLETPRLLRTRAGEPWIAHEDRTWRALTWVDGHSAHAVPSLAYAEEGGALVARFHRAVDDLAHDYVFVRAGVHDTASHLARLEAGAAPASPVPVPLPDRDLLAEARDLAVDILTTARSLAPLPDLPRRHAHGDLKISNLLYRHAHAIALVDLDTLGRQTLAFELGDAMRSWCNPHPEDAGRARFDLDVFAAAMRGYRAVAGDLLTAAEWPAIVLGLETVCVELAARFCADVFEDRYFGWDPMRFPSRRAHNLIRARGQLALGKDVTARREDALAVVCGS
jgi:Ser/Thr protein kinase RdoA (MazF antagonist)